MTSAQTDSLWVLDLEEITVVVNKEKEDYFAGSTIIKNDSLSLSPINSGAMTDFLVESVPVYVKSDAGGLATISVRGTSADHTAIMLRCVNLNSLTLGHSDLFSLPLFLFDGISFQYGSSSSMYGSGAIGGSLHLDSKSDFNKGTKVALQQDLGSFGKSFSGVKLQQSNKSVDVKLKAYYQESENNFTFNYKRIDEEDFYVDTQRNAAYENWGLWGEMSHKINFSSTVSAMIWYDKNWHQIQPNITSNGPNNTFSYYDDQHIRAIADYTYKKSKQRLNVSAAYVWDESMQDGNSSNQIETKRGINQFEYQLLLPFKIKQLIGGKQMYIKPNVYTYDEDLEQYQASFYYSLHKRFGSRGKLSGGIRKTFITDYLSPFAPSIGGSFTFLKKSAVKASVKASAARSYKVPSFNDRFWGEQGNPDLLPESGYSYETGIDASANYKRLKAKVTGNIFLLDVDNWIQWVPKGEWYPLNFSHVVSKGAEVGGMVEYKMEKLKLKAYMQYSYTNALITEQEGEVLEVEKRMPYSPKFMTNYGASAEYKYMALAVRSQYVGQRFNRIVEYNNYEEIDVVSAYSLYDVDITLKPPVFENHRMVFVATTKNIFDIEYQNKSYYAMPGRSYSFSLRYYFNYN